MTRVSIVGRRALLVLAGLLAAAVLVGPASVGAGHDKPAPTPIVFVHGGAGSAAQYESQARRFDSNGYLAKYVHAFEYDSSFATNTFAEVNTRLDAFVDGVRTEHGASQVNLVGHSLGTFVSNTYLSDPARAAKIAKYVGIDGSSNASCGVASDTLDCMGIWQGTNTTGNVGGQNVRLTPQTHVQVATSPESFAAQYEFFTGEPPKTTLILPERGDKVRISGRAVLFPQNVGPAEATVEIWELDSRTGKREDRKPEKTLQVAADGSWGPVRVESDEHYELNVLRAGLLTHHFYFQPFFRSSAFVRMNLAPPGSQIVANTNLSDAHSAAVVVRQKEWWTTHPTGQDDILSISTKSKSGGTQPAVDALTNVTSNGVIGVHVHDAAASPGNSTLALLPFFPTQAFQTGVDVFMPAASPPDGAIRFANAPRGDTSRTQTLNVPNWRSSTDRITVTFNDFVQDIDTWKECKRAKPSPCKGSSRDDDDD
jgi:pimeloyl-ACP methyl ester carboxylesterase